MLPVKNILIGVGLFGAGAAAGYFTANKFLRKGYEEDVEEIQAWYRAKLEEFTEDVEEIHEGPGTCATEDGDPYLVFPQKHEGVNYTRYSKPDLGELAKRVNDPDRPAEDDPDEEEDGDASDEEFPDVNDPEYEAEIERRSDAFIEAQRDARNKGEPYLIDSLEFDTPIEGYRTQDLYYYRKDRSLCEDDDQEVDDVEDVVGLDFEEVLEMQTQCFIRNDRLCCLYHIYRIEGSYAEEVRSVAETPKEREFRLMGRRKRAIDDE